MKKKINLFIGLLAVMAILLACSPTLATPYPTLPPEVLNTIVAMTFSAASTQTAAVLPTSTHTPIPTTPATPTHTPTDTPVPTATIIFRLSSPTPSRTPTSLTPTLSSENYACKVISQKPDIGDVLAPRTDFDARWTVQNIGKKSWDAGSTDYLYVSGDKLHQQDAYDLNKTVAPGQQVDIIVDMIAPKKAGTYSTTWNLRVGQNQFCVLQVVIVVR